MSLVGHLRAMQDAILGAEAGEAELARVGDPERMRIYRSMVRARLAEVGRNAFPRTFDTLGADVTGRAFDAYLESGGPRTRYFWRIPLEFAEVLRETIPSDAPSSAHDLLRFERARWRLRHDETPAPGPVSSLSFELPPLLSPAHELLALGHRVDVRGEESEREERRLALFRNPDHKVEVLALNATSYALLEQMSAPRGRTLTAIVQAVAAERGVELTPRFIERLSQLLELALDKGLLLGSTAPSR